MNSFIETLNQWGGNFPGFAWPMLWQSSLLITVLFALDLLLRRKLRASIRYTLWLVVLVKLCIPPTFALPTSPSWWLHPAPPPPGVVKPKMQNYTVTYDQGPLVEVPEMPLPVFEPPKPVLSKPAWWLMSALSGAAMLLFWMLVRWWQIARLVRWAATSTRLTALLEEAGQSMGMNRSVPVKLTSKAMSPAVCGLFRPVILIPQALAAEFSDEQLRAVLLHELIHLRRRDVWLNFFQTLLQIGYWWHPLVWMANARIRRVREEAVDDAVMLALRDEAETYAPTLLEVAKLALNRPLATLGLVGILESRSALRQRIERLVDFHPPRKAGLTLVSLLGVLAFSAIALPMGEGPVSAAKSNETDAAVTGEQSLTIRVNPEFFFRNLKAQAAKTMQSPTNSWGEIFMELLRDEGVDCNPPHGLAFTNATGDLTTQNVPEQLEIFRRVVEQLNRADGICELPLGNNSLRKSVIIEGRIYPMSAGEFDKFTSGLHRYSGNLFGDEWWSVPPETFKQFVSSIEASGLQVVQRPRIQTAHGIPAMLYVGDRTNGLELGCKPHVGNGFVDLALESTVISGAPVNAVTNHVFSKASAEDRGGIVLRMANYGGHPESNLVAIVSFAILTNSAVHFQDRLVAVIQRGPASNGSTVGKIEGILTDPNFRMVLHALEQRSGTEMLAEPEVVTTSGRNRNRIAMNNIIMDRPVADLVEEVKMGGFLNESNQALDTLVAAGPSAMPELARLLLLGEPSYTQAKVAYVMGAIAYRHPDSAKVQKTVPALILAAQSQNPAVRVYSVQALGAVGRGASNAVPLLIQLTKATDDSLRMCAVEAIGRIGINTPAVRSALVAAMSDNSNDVKVTATQALQAMDAPGNAVKSGEGYDTALTAKRLLDQGKVHFEMGNFEEAKAKMKQVLLVDSGNAAAKYYLGLMQTNQPLISVGTDARKQIVQKLSAIRLEKITFNATPLHEVLRWLSEQARLRDPERKGINFMIIPNQSDGTNDVAMIPITINPALNPALTNLTLGDALDAVLLVAPKPLKYSVQDFAIIFSERQTTTELFTQTFKISPEVFFKNLENKFGYATNKLETGVQSMKRVFGLAGVNWDSPSGKSIFYNDRLGKLFVKATISDLDIIERAISDLMSSAQQIHIQARFVEVPKEFLGKTGMFSTQTNSPNGGFTGILTSTNAQFVLKALESRKDAVFLAKPEVTTLSGRQTQVRVTTTQDVITDVSGEQQVEMPGVVVSNSITFKTEKVETGPVLDATATVLADGYTISLRAKPSLTEFFGYASPKNPTPGYTNAITLPEVRPSIRVREKTCLVNLYDGQTLMMGGFQPRISGEENLPKQNDKELLVFITATIIDPAGNRVHKDSDKSAAQGGIPPQPASAK